jgi:germacradienol/geosmin synthase
MAAFDTPTLYMPWPARRNPHVDRAREHNRVWVREIGIVGDAPRPDDPVVWTAGEFEAFDFAGFCAYVHPDAAGPELDLLTDWYVWLFFLDDDFFARYVRTSDLDGARTYLERLRAFMPLDSTADPQDEPASAVERGLCDLWPRTGASERWRRRFVANNEILHEEFLWEVANHSRRRIANPIEYIALRRRTGGTPWSADLVEHALAGELAPGLMDARPLQILRDIFADTVGLHNDIVSYAKEVEEGAINNGVMVVEHFLRCDLQQAVDTVNDLLTARLCEFERVAVTMLPPLFDEHGLDARQRATALAYVRGLEDWMAGDRKWHQTTGRYARADERAGSPEAARWAMPTGPSGLGAQGARIAPPRAVRRAPQLRAAGGIELYMPFEVHSNAHLAATRRHEKVWAREMGLLDHGVWNEARLHAIDCGLLTALTHPDAPGRILDLINQWNVWGFYCDDLFVEAFKRGRPLGVHDLALARAMLERLWLFMPLHPDAPAAIPATPLERALQDLWSRTALRMDADLRAAFATTVRRCYGSVLWELENLAARRVPESIEYIETRRLTVVAEFSTNLEVVCTPGRKPLPDAVMRTRPLRELTMINGDWHGLTNDLVSERRERAYDRDPNTAPSVIARLLGCDPGAAARLVGKLVSERVRQFEHIVTNELEPLLDALDLDDAVRDDVRAYVAGLEVWMAGSHEWSRRTGRYDPQAGGLRPTGFGTAAARLALTPAIGTSAPQHA